jgi:hypothetical protein
MSFQHAGRQYEPGDEWTQPADWKAEDLTPGAVVFAYDKPTGVQTATGPELDRRVTVLPVAAE